MPDLSALPARELDALVARALGWTEVQDKALDRTLGGSARSEWTEGHDAPWFARDPNGKWRKIPRYSTDWTAMGSLLGALRERGWTVETWSHPARDDVEVRLTRSDNDCARERLFAPTLPRAVAEAAVLALEGESS